MKLIWLAWKNIVSKPLTAFFNILLIAISVGLICTILLIDDQFKNHFEKNLAKTDLIISAKGSPLQSVLCNLFHVDAPTGNISISDIKAFLNPNHPLIKESLPILLGDNVRGFRLVGTTTEIFNWYNLTIDKGEKWSAVNEAVIGSEVAKALQLKIGSTFTTGHGLVDEEDLTIEHASQFKVVGILQQSGTIADRLLLTGPQSYWQMHAGHEHEEGDSASHSHSASHSVYDTIDHGDHVHVVEKNQVELLTNADLIAHPDQEITSLLIRYKMRNIQTLNFGRVINENTDVMSANPAIELNRMYELTGAATEVMRWIAYLVAALASLSIFVNLLQALKERKFELALLRTTGATKRQTLLLVMFEGIIIGLLGAVIGIVLAHLSIEIIARIPAIGDKYGIQQHVMPKVELTIILLSVFTGILASIVPAVLAYKQDTHKILQEM